MNSRILLTFIAAAVFSSCSTMYKTGQTPDDVYYSPGQERGGYVSTDDDRNDNGYDNHTDVSSRYLRMKSINRNRWSNFDDDFNYWNDYRWNNSYMLNSWYGRPAMGFGYNNGGMGYGYGHMGYNNAWGYSNMYYNSPWFWNNPFGSYYYGTPVIILNSKPVYRNPVANGPRSYNLNTYTSTNRQGYYTETSGRRFNNAYSGSNAPVRVFNNTQGGTTNPGRGGRYINTNSSSGNGGGYNPRSSSGNSDSRNSSPTRTFDRSNNNSGGSTPARSSGGSSSGGSAPVRSFPRGG